MKIVVNARFLLPQLEGIGHYTLQMLDHLSSVYSDDEFHVVLDRDYNMPLLNRENIIRHVLYPSARHPILWYYWFESRLPALFKRIQPDVFFSPDGYLSLRSKIPTVMTIHDLAYIHYPLGSQWSHRLFLKRFMPQYLHRADIIACVSQFTADDVITHFPHVADRNKVIPNGVSDDFKRLSPSEVATFREKSTSGKSYFLYLGAIHPRKNVARLIKAFEEYKRATDHDTCLVLAGRMAWDANDVRATIEISQYKRDILHFDYSDEDIPTLVGAAKAMCYPSLFEGFGLPTLEAMACGVPVITSANSAMQEVCGPAALYVDPEDTSSISSAMISISSDDQLYQNLVASGIERAVLYSWRRSAKELYRVMAEGISASQNK